MGIKQSMWQYLMMFLNSNMDELTLGNSFSLASDNDFSATCFVIQRNSPELTGQAMTELQSS